MAKSALIGQRRALNNSSHLTPPISSLMIFSLTYFKHEKVGLNERRCKGGDKRDFYPKYLLGNPGEVSGECAVGDAPGTGGRPGTPGTGGIRG